jgi:hypothetical protein
MAMAHEFETGSNDGPAPDAEPDVTRNAPTPSGDLVARGRTVIDPTAAHDLVVRGVTVIDRARHSYHNKVVNRGRTVIDRRSQE